MSAGPVRPRPLMHIMNISGRGFELNAFLIISLGPCRELVVGQLICHNFNDRFIETLAIRRVERENPRYFPIR